MSLVRLCNQITLELRSAASVLHWFSAYQRKKGQDRFLPLGSFALGGVWLRIRSEAVVDTAIVSQSFARIVAYDCDIIVAVAVILNVSVGCTVGTSLDAAT